MSVLFILYFVDLTYSKSLPGFVSVEVTNSNGENSCLFVSTTKLWPFSSDSAEGAQNQAELVCNSASLQFADITSQEEIKALREITSKHNPISKEQCFY